VEEFSLQALPKSYFYFHLFEDNSFSFDDLELFFNNIIMLPINTLDSHIRFPSFDFF